MRWTLQKLNGWGFTNENSFFGGCPHSSNGLFSCCRAKDFWPQYKLAI